MEFKPSSNDLFLLHDKLYRPGFEAKREVLTGLLRSGIGAYTASAHELRPGELNELMHKISNHPELKKLGWTRYDTDHVKKALGEHFAPTSHTSHTIPPAAGDNDVAPVRQIV